MQVLADGGRLGHGGDGVRTEVFGVRARVADAPDPLDLADRPQQRCEQRTRPVGAVTPVGVDVLAEQGHLGGAGGCQRLDLGEDLVHRAAHLLAAHRGHDAEGAGVIAADLDRHPRGMRKVGPDRQCRRKCGCVLGRCRLQDLDDGPPQLACLA